ncbi:MAG TPA: TfoX/Sxy family protein [Thermoanaerobaculia bacterium]|jgi:DNA transformation protein|nr:TfoX/Sxy family protein [Thermoanaerobaculia bacterium]
MPRQNEFCDYLMDRLAPLGEPSYRFMFGGYGVYLDGLMMAIVADDVLLLRADEENRPDFEARGIGPFNPYPDKISWSMPYYTVPDDVLEDQDLFLEWAGRSREAALRAEAKKAKGKGKKGKRGATRK